MSRLYTPSGDVVRFTPAQLRKARDRALAKLKADYEAQRRQIMAEYKAAMDNSGWMPDRKEP